METQVILVDAQDRPVGTMEKVAAHLGNGVLHRAFSVFVFNRQGQVLLQQRSKEKMLWPLFWANTCCSHPAPDEETEAAGSRRLWEEVGIRGACRQLYAFEYHAHYGDVGSEHELCHVLVCISDAQAEPNPDEVADTRWLTREQVDALLLSDAVQFTPWFKLEWAQLCGQFPAFDDGFVKQFD